MITSLLNKFRSTKTKNNLFFFAFFTLLFLGNLEKVTAQVATEYVFAESLNPSYASLQSDTKTILVPGATPAVWDQAVVNTPIGFSFIFNGTAYTALNVSANGFVTFGLTAPATTLVTPISSTTGYSGAIAGYAATSTPGLGVASIIYDTTYPAFQANCVSKLVTGVAGSRILKIEWRSVRRKADVADVAMSFQIWLYETTNVIEVHYDVLSSPANTINGQVGLRGTANTDYNNRLFVTNANWPLNPLTVTTAGTANTSTVNTRVARTIDAGANRLFKWTPVNCTSPVAPVTISGLSATTATATWTAPALVPLSYDVEIRTSGAGGSGAAGLVQSGNVTSPTVTNSFTGLVASTTYTVWVRSNCGGSGNSAWIASSSFATYCLPANIPYFQFFDGPVVPALSPQHAPTMPTCTTQQNVGLGNPWVISSADYRIDSAMDENLLMYNGSNPGNANPANVWFFTEGINLVGGSTYRISYNYGGNTSPTIQNSMQVAYGTAPLAANMTIPIDNHPLIKSSLFGNVVNFVAPSTGVFYFGIKATSIANQGQMYVDDLQIVDSNCLRPSAVSVSSIGASSAVLNWTPPSPTPSSGYAYYVSTSNTPPTNDALPTGTTGPGITSVTLTGLAGSTNYYFWVRSSCGFGEYGEWVALVNGANSYFTTLVASLYCASTSAPSVNYFTNFSTTAAITNVTNPSGFSLNGYGDFTSQIVTQAQAGTVNFSTTINDLAGAVGVAIWVDWNQDGDFIDAGEQVFSTPTQVTTSPFGTFNVPAGATLGVTTMRIRVDWSFPNPPTPCGAITRGETEDYAFQVVTPPPVLTLGNTNDTLCAGTPSNPIIITAGLSDYQTFTWSPSTGVTGTGIVGDPYIITTSTSQSYVLTAVQTVAPFRFNTTIFRYNANPLPTPITISTPSGTTVCQAGPPIPLVATGGIVAGFPIVSQDFNAGTNDWTTSLASGSPLGLWTLRPNNYTVGLGNINSNDVSQFYLADSDTGLSPGSTVSTFLTSPVFSTVGFSQASLSFWHVYRFFSGDSGTVQITTDGATWVDLATYVSNQAPALNSFSNVIIPLNTYLGQATLQVRFRYNASWDWFWAIDNVLVSGSASSAVIWTPATGLYTDTLGTVPYVAGTGAATVYAMPGTDTIYTGTASTPAPVCTRSATVSVVVTPIVAGTASSNQIICTGSPSDLTLTGNSHPVVKWQYASDLAFTVSVTDIASSNSNTLLSAQMPPVAANRYYRAVINNGTCVAYSNVITVTYNSSTWNGTAWSNGIPNATKSAIFAGNFTAAVNLVTCSVTVLSGNVSFNFPRTLTVTNNVDVLGGTLNIGSGGSLVQISDAAINTGNITSFRNTTPVRQSDYTYWSSPVSPQTLVALSPLTASTKYFSFNPSTNAWVNINSNSLMDAGKGYIIRAPQTFSTTVPAIYNGSFFGTPHNGVITTPIVGGTLQRNLIGNPYPSALNADLFLSSPLNSGIIDATIYLWTHNTTYAAGVYSPSDYALYNYMGGIGTGTAVASGTGNTTVPTGKIASGQGFFIKGLANGVATFNNAMRVGGVNNQFYRSDEDDTNEISELERHRFWLDISNTEGAYKQILIGYIENATNGIDRGFDSGMIDSGNAITLYSKLDATKLSIQGRTLPFVVEDQVPLGYKSTIAGTYTIMLSDFDGLFAGEQNIYLEDTVLNVIHDMKASAYTFATDSGVFENRFIVRYNTDAALGIDTSIFNDNSIVVYKNLQGLHINSGVTNMSDVIIYDIQGRVVAQKQVGAAEAHFTTLPVTQQVLLVKITSEDGVVVTKKVVY